MRGLVTFPPGIARAADILASAAAGDGARRAWGIAALAALTAALDRFAVLRVADAVLGKDQPWRAGLAMAAAAAVAMFLLGRWASLAALGLADRAGDAALERGASAATRADWQAPGARDALRTVSASAGAVREGAGQVAAALPAIAALPVTAAWLAWQQPPALAIAAVAGLAAALLLRREAARARAALAVLDDAEAALGSATGRLLRADASASLASGDPGTFCAQALWPPVDDATRAASVSAGANARLSALLAWAGFLLVIALLAFAPADGQDREWTRAAVLLAATLPHARKAAWAWLALERAGDAAIRVDAVCAAFPAVAATVPFAPARWTAIAFREVRATGIDTPGLFLPPAGPFDLDLHRGEVVAVAGPSPFDRATMLHLICGLLAPDWGAVLLDGRPVPPAMLRGLCSALLDGEAPAAALPANAAPARAAALLARFDLPHALLDPASRDGALAQLGTAERARLAIVAMELEDRPVRLYGARAAALPPRYREAFAETLREARSRGRTAVVATGDAALLAAADRVLRMQDGRLLPDGEAAP